MRPANVACTNERGRAAQELREVNRKIDTALRLRLMNTNCTRDSTVLERCLAA